MITYVNGNLFKSPAHVLVNTVNTIGVMGRGIAKEFREIYPEMYKIYRLKCEQRELTVGKLLLYRTDHKWVLNFPTKQHFRYPSKIEYIQKGLETFVDCYVDLGLTSVAFPQLGCGTGGLNWETEVQPLMEHYLKHLPIDTYIHIQNGNARLPKQAERVRLREWLRSEPAELSFDDFWHDVTRLVVQRQEQPNGVSVWLPTTESESVPTAIGLARNGDTFQLSKEELEGHWHTLTGFGFLSSAALRTRVEDAAEPFLDLLTHLPYVEPADLPKQAGSVEPMEIFVQFVPYTDSEKGSSAPTLQHTLFDQ